MSWNLSSYNEWNLADRMELLERHFLTFLISRYHLLGIGPVGSIAMILLLVFTTMGSSSLLSFEDAEDTVIEIADRLLWRQCIDPWML